MYASCAEEEPLNDAILNAFQAGHDAEEGIIKYAARRLSDAPFIVGCRNHEIVPIETDHAIIEGHVDAVMQRESDGKLVLLEAKNLAPTTISKLKNHGGVMGATPNYYTQIQLYLYGMQKHGLEIDQAIFIARNKKSWKDDDTRKYYVQRFDYDCKEVAAALEKADSIAQCIATDTEVPPPNDPNEEFFCRDGWCTYSSNCREYWRLHGGEKM